jgi:hypothetical protein
VAVAKAPLVPMRRVLEGKAELWVVQLPAQVGGLDARAVSCPAESTETAAAGAPRNPVCSTAITVLVLA